MNKYQTIDYCKNQFKYPSFSTLSKKNFIFPKNFSELLSYLQTDEFNHQLYTEIIFFKKLKYTKLQLKNKLIDQILKIIRKNFFNSFSETKIYENHKTLKKNNKTYFHKISKRHDYAFRKILKK